MQQTRRSPAGDSPSRCRELAEPLFLDGARYMARGESGLAERCFQEAIRLVPDFAEAYSNLGMLFERRGQVQAAERHYRSAIACNPGIGETYLNLAALFTQQKRFSEAETACRRALSLMPDSPVAWSNFGVLQACRKQEIAAEQSYRTAMGLDADYRPAQFNLSYLLLRQGRLEEGWRRLEARDWYAALQNYLACPRWRGETLVGKAILIGIEAGHGDMIQFCRYAAVLKAQGASRIGLICQPALKTLFATLAAVDIVIALDEALPALHWDCWAPPLSIPFHCKTCIDSIPASLPYLHAAPGRIGNWAAVLERDCAPGELRVGLVWKGNPRFENDADRSLPALASMADLAGLAGVRFVSLQKGAGENEAAAPPAGLGLVNLGPGIKDFADTAAIIASLDLVISVDTAVAHLAGALGKPCWVLLPDYKTDWRWLVGRDDSPWYPGVMRLFRQHRMGDWRSVMAELRLALAAMLRKRGMAKPDREAVNAISSSTSA